MAHALTACSRGSARVGQSSVLVLADRGATAMQRTQRLAVPDRAHERAAHIRASSDGCAAAGGPPYRLGHALLLRYTWLLCCFAVLRTHCTTLALTVMRHAQSCCCPGGSAWTARPCAARRTAASRATPRPPPAAGGPTAACAPAAARTRAAHLHISRLRHRVSRPGPARPVLCVDNGRWYCVCTRTRHRAVARDRA